MFAKILPHTAINDKRKLLNELSKLNVIRNYVMHPVKGVPITEDDFVFVREFYKKIRSGGWRTIARNV